MIFQIWLRSLLLFLFYFWNVSVVGKICYVSPWTLSCLSEGVCSGCSEECVSGPGPTSGSGISWVIEDCAVTWETASEGSFLGSQSQKGRCRLIEVAKQIAFLLPHLLIHILHSRTHVFLICMFPQDYYSLLKSGNITKYFLLNFLCPDWKLVQIGGWVWRKCTFVLNHVISQTYGFFFNGNFWRFVFGLDVLNVHRTVYSQQAF